MKLSIVLLIIFFSFNSSAKAISLEQLYESAKSNTASIKDKQYALEIAKEERKQVRSSVFPSLDAVNANNWEVESGSGTESFSDSHQSSTYLSLSQKLFQGGAEYAGLRAAKLLPKIADLEKQQQEIILFYNVAQKFFALKRLRLESKNLEEQKDALIKRVNTTAERVKIGRNKKADILAARSQLARLIASIAQVNSEVTQVEQELMNMTGLTSLGELEVPEASKYPVPENGLEKLEESPQIKAMQLSVEKADETVSVAKGEYLPSLDVEGRYYVDRKGYSDDTEWDVSLNATWNLFNGGYDNSEKRIATLESLRLQARLKDLKRNLQNEYKAQLAKLKRQEEALSRLEQATKLSKDSYIEYLREADRGLVNQLQVIQAFEDYLSVQRSYDQERFSTDLTRIYLRSLAGIKP